MVDESSGQSLEKRVQDALKELGQAPTQHVFEKVQIFDKTATLAKVRRILKEGGFAKTGIALITFRRKDGESYERECQVWIHTNQVPKVVTTDAGKASVEVIVRPRRPRVPYRMIEEMEHAAPEGVEVQDLEVTVRNADVRNLQVKVFFNDGGIWFDGKVLFYLKWGQSRISDFVANQTDPVDFWMAYKIKGVEKLLLNLWAGKPVILPLMELYQRPNPYIDVNLQFIGEGLNEPFREYRLNAQSWDALNLIERPQSTS